MAAISAHLQTLVPARPRSLKYRTGCEVCTLLSPRDGGAHSYTDGLGTFGAHGHQRRCARLCSSPIRLRNGVRSAPGTAPSAPPIAARIGCKRIRSVQPSTVTASSEAATRVLPHERERATFGLAPDSAAVGPTPSGARTPGDPSQCFGHEDAMVVFTIIGKWWTRCKPKTGIQGPRALGKPSRPGKSSTTAIRPKVERSQSFM